MNRRKQRDGEWVVHHMSYHARWVVHHQEQRHVCVGGASQSNGLEVDVARRSWWKMWTRRGGLGGCWRPELCRQMHVTCKRQAAK